MGIPRCNESRRSGLAKARRTILPEGEGWAEALAYLRDLIQRLPDVEQKAQCIFTRGQSAEKVGDFTAAVRYYKAAMAMEPTQLKLTEPHPHSIIGCVLKYRPIGRI